MLLCVNPSISGRHGMKARWVVSLNGHGFFDAEEMPASFQRRADPTQNTPNKLEGEESSLKTAAGMESHSRVTWQQEKHIFKPRRVKR